MVTFTINRKQYQAVPGETVIKVLIREGIDIPYLCYHESLAPYGACRLCMVDVTSGDRPGITASCALPAVDGLAVETDTPHIVQMRKVLLEMYLGEAPGSEEIRALAEKYGVDSTRFTRTDLSASGDRCVLCGVCARVCRESLNVGAIDYSGRGIRSSIHAPWFELSGTCIGCGSCAANCPTSAITFEDQGEERLFRIAGSVFSRHKLVPCELCNALYATEKYLDYFRNTAGEQGETQVEKNLCPVCARQRVAAEFVPKAWRT